MAKAAEEGLPPFEIAYLDPKTLLPHPRNYRLHPDKQAISTQESISRFGWLAAPIVNKTSGHLLDGHLRVKLAREEGLAAIPVRVVSVPEADEEAILASFDRLGELRERDDEQLAALLRDISDREGELPPGWGDEDLAELLKGLGESGGSGLLPEADPDDVPEVVETRALQGDLWGMEDHRLAVCDCTDGDAVQRLFGPKRLQMVWTDPPYGVSYAEKNEFLNAVAPGNRNQRPIENDSLSEADTERLCREALALACDYGVPGAVLYVACPPGTPLPHFIAAVASSGFQFKHSLAWVKNQFVLGRCDYHYRHEIILYGWKDGAHYFLDDHSQDSVFQIDKPRKSEEHPTMKPVELVRRMVLNSSRPSDIVYDPFLGSGSTLLACEDSGRVCYGCEIAPGYADVILTRWETATGKQAQLLVRNG